MWCILLPPVDPCLLTASVCLLPPHTAFYCYYMPLQVCFLLTIYCPRILQFAPYCTPLPYAASQLPQIDFYCPVLPLYNHNATCNLYILIRTAIVCKDQMYISRINAFSLPSPLQEHIYKLMKSDSYSRFIRSSAYQELLQAKKKVKFLNRLETAI